MSGAGIPVRLLIRRLKVRFLPRSPLSITYAVPRAVCVLVARASADLAQRLALRLRDHVPINVHGRPDIGVTHELLLDDKRRSHAVQQRPIRVPERVRTEFTIPAAEGAFW